MGHDLTPEQLDELAWRWYEPLSRCASIEAGAVDLLARLRERAGAGDRVQHVRARGGTGPASGPGGHAGVPARAGLLLRRAIPQASPEDLPDRLAGDRHRGAGDAVRGRLAHCRHPWCKPPGLISVLKDPHDRYANSSVRPRGRMRSLRELDGIIAELDSQVDSARPSDD